MQLSKKAYELVAAELQKRIETRILNPGDRLDTIENLAKQFRVGRSTVREALSLLKAQGLIESVQGGGTYVAKNQVQHFSAESAAWLTSAPELKQLLQVRKILEVGSITLAAEQRTDKDLRELSRIVQQMKSAVGNEDMSQLYDVNFHLAIAHATQNALLESMMHSLSATMMRTMRDSRKLWLYSEAQSAEGLYEEHLSMFEAIAIRDGHTAAKTMRDHLSRVEAAFQRQD